MSSYLPSVFGENLLDVFDDFDHDFFRGFGRPEHVLYGKNAARLIQVLSETTLLDEGYMPISPLNDKTTEKLRNNLKNHLKI